MKAKITDLQAFLDTQEAKGYRYIDLNFEMFVALFMPQINNIRQVIEQVKRLEKNQNNEMGRNFCRKSEFSREVFISRVTLDKWVERGVVVLTDGLMGFVDITKTLKNLKFIADTRGII